MKKTGNDFGSLRNKLLIPDEKEETKPKNQPKEKNPSKPFSKHKVYRILHRILTIIVLTGSLMIMIWGLVLRIDYHKEYNLLRDEIQQNAKKALEEDPYRRYFKYEYTTYHGYHLAPLVMAHDSKGQKADVERILLDIKGEEWSKNYVDDAHRLVCIGSILLFVVALHMVMTDLGGRQLVWNKEWYLPQITGYFPPYFLFVFGFFIVWLEYVIGFNMNSKEILGMIGGCFLIMVSVPAIIRNIIKYRYR